MGRARGDKKETRGIEVAMKEKKGKEQKEETGDGAKRFWVNYGKRPKV